MEVLKKLQRVTENKKYNGFASLKIGFHRIENFRYTKNKFGKKGDGTDKSVLAELENEVVFLPQHLSRKIEKDDLQKLNSAIERKKEKIFLYFGGKIEGSE